MKPRSVLVVEDSRTQAERLQAVLEEAGYLVEVAHDGETGVAAVEARPPDAVISDIVMPGVVDGYELCRRIKAGPHRDVPVILLTSLSDPADIIRGLECGADNFLRKPYLASYLLERLKVLFATREIRAKDRVRFGMKVLFLGREVSINAEHQQVLDLLVSTFEEAVIQNRELRQREEELRIAKAELDRYAGALEQRLTSVLETIPDALFSVDASLGNLFYISQAAERVFGFAADEMLRDPQSWRKSLHPDDLATVLDGFSRAVQDGAAQTVEGRFKHPDGSWRWIQLHVAAVSDGPGAPVRLDGVAHDVTDRRRAEEELQRTESDYRGLVDAAPLGIYRSTLDGRYRTVNPALITMLGYGRAEELLRLDIARDVFAEPDGRARLLAQFEHADEARAEAQWKRKDGSLITVQLHIRLVRDASGSIDGYDGLVEDVTEQRSLENQFRQAQRLEAVGRLAGGVAHDFNNVLTAITGYTELMLEDTGPRDPKREDLLEIRAAAGRATALTRQLLAFSRKQVLQTRVLDVNDVVRTLAKMLQRLIGEDVKLESALAPALGAVRADPGQLEQVILNLAVNSRDAMPGGGRLTIETANVVLDEDYVHRHTGAAAGRHVLLAVSDTGCGMDAETQAHIFEPFFTTKELGKGTGLGLATVYGIVKQSGGHLWVYSEPGKGTTFKIYFPQVDAVIETAELASAAQPVMGGRETVLVAEDEPAVREIVTEVLAKKGYQVLRAPDGQTALELARAHDGAIQLLLTDIVMPGLTGRELADALRAERPGVRVLYMSGYTDDAVVRHGVLEEGMPYLQKPFAPNALAVKVREVLEGLAGGGDIVASGVEPDA
jgi:PAS domain S-box-containing protein